MTTRELTHRACKIKNNPLFLILGLDFDLVSVCFFCRVGASSELGYLSPGEYGMHRNVTMSERAWSMHTAKYLTGFASSSCGNIRSKEKLSLLVI